MRIRSEKGLESVKCLDFNVTFHVYKNWRLSKDRGRLKIEIWAKSLHQRQVLKSERVRMQLCPV